MQRAKLAAVLALTLAGPIQAEEFISLKGHGGPIMALAISPDGQLASASFDNSVGLWTGSVPDWLEGHDAAVTAVSFLSGDTLLSGGDDFAVRLWSPRGSRLLGQHKGKVQAVRASPDGMSIATAS